MKQEKEREIHCTSLDHYRHICHCNIEEKSGELRKGFNNEASNSKCNKHVLAVGL